MWFDCAKVSTFVEREICGNPALSRQRDRAKCRSNGGLGGLELDH
ncbi:hypothetical protein [Burkholderia pyrrocinia]|nr:hypothetical protein [Burkholderia pyrrocinia]